MTKSLNVLEVNEKDNALSAFGKRMFNGAYQTYLIWGTIGIGCVVIGQALKKLEDKKVETTEEEAGE